MYKNKVISYQNKIRILKIIKKKLLKIKIVIVIIIVKKINKKIIKIPNHR